MRNSSHLTHPEKHYWKMVERADLLSDVIGSSKKHSLLNLFELTSELIRAYDLERFDVPDTKP
jgi:HTH-type transcriptional regulator/antitoxin HigA